VWWAGAEATQCRAEDAANWATWLLALNPAGVNFPVPQQVFAQLSDKNSGAAERKDVGSVLYNRGMINACSATEAVRTAQGKFGTRPLTGEQVRWGHGEPRPVTAEKLKKLGLTAS